MAMHSEFSIERDGAETHMKFTFDPIPTKDDMKMESLVSRLAEVFDRMIHLHAMDVPSSVTHTKKETALRREVIKRLEGKHEI